MSNSFSLFSPRRFLSRPILNNRISSTRKERTRKASRALWDNALLVGLWNWYQERFTKAGRGFLGATFVFMASGASSLEMQFYPSFVYASSLWLVAALLSRRRPHVALKARHAARITAGETLPVEIELIAARKHGELSVGPLRLAPHLELVPSQGLLVSPLINGEVRCAQLGVKCLRRGVYVLRGWSVESDFPFGLLRVRQSFARETSLLVLPRFTPLQSLELPANHDARDGVAQPSRVGDSFELLGNRDWRDGDSRRDINWRATARLQKTVVREMCCERWPRANIILDTHIAAHKTPFSWTKFLRSSTSTQAESSPQDDFERAVSLCASLADFMARENYIVELFAAGAQILHLDVEPQTSHLDAILEVLATVECAPHSPFQELCATLHQSGKIAATTICILLDWDESRRDFIEELSRGGALVKTIVVRDNAISLPLDAKSDVMAVDRAHFESGASRL